MRVLRTLLRLIGVIVVSGLVLSVAVVAVAPEAAQVFTASRAESPPLELDALSERSLIFAGDGSVLATLHGEENRSPVPLDHVHGHVVDTILTVEDEDFYNHGGVNLRATMRALFENVSAGGIEQGGSTITMQLVKNALLTPEQDINRKSREIALAYRLENEMSKDEILERYLNTVYFGGGAYGVQAAAEIYWEKSAQDLTWPEAALLAALIRNPVGYDPINFPEISTERRQIVLDLLADEGLITEDEAVEYGQTPLPTSRKEVLPPPEDYFVEEVKSQLLRDERLGASYQERENAVFRGGLRIHTTINPIAQAQAEQARAEVLPDGIEPFTAALVGVEPSTGAVRMMVGGPGFENFQYNIATQAPGRQTGSSFKTFVLAAALENGFVPTDSIGGGGAFPNPGGEPDPYQIDGRGGTIASVTAASSNGAFVRLGQTVGLDEVAETARRLGLTTPLDPGVISMPLGVFDVRPIEMASAYAALANGGIRNPPYLVERVEDAYGNIVFEHEPEGIRSVSRQTACLATQVLGGVVSGGTGRAARIEGQPVAGKTGTTNLNTDAWFVGYSPYLATAVWMGDPGNPDDPSQPLQQMNNVGGIRVQGGTYPARIWSAFNGAYHEQLPRIDFPECEDTRGGRSVGDGASDGDGGDEPTRRRGGDGGGGGGGDEAPDEDEDDAAPEREEGAPPPSAPPSSAPPTSTPPSTPATDPPTPGE